MPANAELKAYLETRRSIPAFQLGEPGPGREDVMEILALATRVPDHGKLAPWRFVVYAGHERKRISLALAEVAVANNPELPAEMIEVEKTRLTRAPLVIAVISRAAPHVKIPQWEQVMSAGAVCLNLLMAANALGYAANWLTEWYAFDEAVHPLLGIAPDEKVAGFIHIGTPQIAPFERARPDVAELITWAGE